VYHHHDDSGYGPGLGRMEPIKKPLGTKVISLTSAANLPVPS